MFDKAKMREFLDRAASYAYTLDHERVVLPVEFIPDLVERFLGGKFNG